MLPLSNSHVKPLIFQYLKMGLSMEIGPLKSWFSWNEALKVGPDPILLVSL